MRKKIFTFFISILAILNANPFIVLAETNITEEDLTAKKIAIKDETKVGEYEIKINVPGKETIITEGYNILFVTDASYSMDRIKNGETLSKWQKMRNAIIEIANEVLPSEDSSKNFNKLGLITFGIDSHVNIPLTSSREEFLENLPITSGEALLPGRSATNNEVGLLGAREYLESISLKDPEHTFVIYITDGESNMNEEALDWYTLIINGLKYRGIEVLALNRSYLMTTLVTLDANKDNEEISYLPLFDTLMDEIKELYIEKTENNIDNISIDDMLQTIGTNDEELIKILNNGINTMYNQIGYNFNTKYSSGDFEKLFSTVNWVSDNINTYEGTEYYEQIEEQDREKLLYYIQDIFYIPMTTKSNPRDINAQRAVDEGNKLKEYATIYTIAYNTSDALYRDDAKKIMDPNYEGNGSNYTSNIGNHFSSGYYFANIEEISKALKNLTEEITYTKYANAKVIDYTSKWIIPMDINGDNIFDKKDIIITNNGLPVENTNIEVIELTEETISTLSQEEQEQIKNDVELVNNTNNKIYKITWNITDGILHSYDQYQLSYRVKVDTQENDFESGKNYKANGITTLTYDKLQKEATEEEPTIIASKFNIKVPEVSQKENIIIITKKDNKNNLLPGADFDISSENNSSIVKEYSKDGINWTKNNTNNEATYFRFSGLYDFNYVLEETKTPENFIKHDNKIYDFTNLENQYIENTIINELIDCEVIIHYVIKVSDEYIPLNIYAKDDQGNVLPGFENVNLEDITLTNKINEEFETIYKEIQGYIFDAVYKGNLAEDSSILNKLKGNIIKNKFTKEKQEYTYVYEIETGLGGDELPPKTGVQAPKTYNISTYLLLGLALILKKFIC